MLKDGRRPAKAESAPSRSQLVLLEVREMITSGEFPAGFHLQEIPLAEQLGVSRTPVREALTMLAHEGLLEPGPKRGYKVRSFTIEEIINAYEMRATLEGAACRALAERGLDVSIISRLKEILDFGDQILEREAFGPADQEPWGEMNSNFHSALIDAARNVMLKEFLERCYRVPLAGTKHVHWYKFDKENFELAKSAHRDHHQIFNAILNRQATRAEARMREHIYLSQELVRKHFRTQTVGFDTVANFNPGIDWRLR